MLQVGDVQGFKTFKDHAKKKTKHYQEQDPQKVKDYLEKIRDIPKDKIAYVDETGIDSYLCREYARASRGESVYGRFQGRKFQRSSIVAAQEVLEAGGVGPARLRSDGGPEELRTFSR